MFSISVKLGSSPSTRTIKSSSNPSKVESKKARSSVISSVPDESGTSTVRIKETKSRSASMEDTVIPVAVYSTSYVVPSTSTGIVSAYTSAKEIIVNSTKPKEIFKRVLTLGKAILSEVSFSIE